MVKFLKRNLIGINTFFVVLPIVIFSFGFLKIYIAIPFSGILLYCYYKICKSEKLNDDDLIFTKKELIISLIIIFVWLFFSGIGNFSFQNDDWNVRNAVLRDLINYDWPVIFSTETMQNATEELKSIDSVGFVYYFAYWLPAALFGKLFGIAAANIFLFIWTFLIILNILFLMKRYLKKNTYLILFFLIAFSGMDILGFLNDKYTFFSCEHLEWWAKNKIQYSSNTTQLYWVFNQSVMAWLITILCLNSKNKNSTVFLGTLLFAYSPFATIGILPIIAYIIIKKLIIEKDILKFIFSSEILNVFLVLIIFGSFYLSADSSISVRGFLWEFNKDIISNMLMFFIIFYLVEFLPVGLLIIKDQKIRDGLFVIVFIELLLIPIYKMTPANDFCMRVSIVPLFILMLYFIKYISDIEKEKLIYKIVVAFFIACSIMTPVHEIGRSVHNTILWKRNRI